MPVTILGPDGVSYNDLFYSTSRNGIFLSGSLPQDAVEVRVSFNGSGFSSYSGLVRWGDGSWIFPDPSYEPDGIFLSPGSNSFQISAVLPSGSGTNVASASISLIGSSQPPAYPPTSLSLERFNDSVLVSVEPPSDPSGHFRGVNFYASAFPGGGASGYTRINVNLVSEYTVVQKTEKFFESSTDVAILLDPNGNQVQDPTLFRISGDQVSQNGSVLQSDFSNTVEVPETAVSLRFTSSLEQVRQVRVYSFNHNRSFGPSSAVPTVAISGFSSLNPDQPLYYVVTALFFDPVQRVEYETSFSTEVVGSPASITKTLGSIPAVSRQDILQQFVTSVFRSNPQIKVEAGSVLRDTVIDPFSSESERLRFLLDFYHRARTPALLLQIDDPEGSGTSVPVSSSSYKLGLKSALYLETNSEVQDLIDSAFESYASNFGVSRRPGVSSRAEVTFYTSVRPQSTVLIPIGTQVSGGGVVFSVVRSVSIPLSRVASYFDPVSGFYRINAPVQSVEVGVRTNLGAGQIRAVVSSIGSTIRVTNSAPAFGGEDPEGNLSLSVRAQNRLSSVDTGTAQGYKQTVASVPGVVKVNVVGAGNPLMQRDRDQSGVHRGGKVDIWVQGSNFATVTDTFCFVSDVKQDEQFVVIDLPNLRFRALDPELSESNPITQMLDYPSLGYELKNITTGQVFDLTGVQILSYDTIGLDVSIPQPSVTISDIVLGSYRSLSRSDFLLTRQPVDEVVSLVGESSGSISSDSFSLVHPNSPLTEGRSGISGDYLSISGTVGDGAPVVVTDEAHVLVGQYQEFLDKLGADYFSIIVKSSDGLTTYAGPDDPGGSPDYFVTLGNQTTAISITRTDSSSIPSGAGVLISYEHSENFVVSYSTNLVVSVSQGVVDSSKHATADVLVKEALPVPIDLEATVILSQGFQPGIVDTSIRTNLSNFFGNLRLGDPVRQSDVIGILEGTTGVSYVVIPLTRMTIRTGSTVLAESVPSGLPSDSVVLSGLSTNSSVVFIFSDGLSFSTSDGGGSGYFVSVSQDESDLVLLPGSSVLASLGVEPGLSYIIGRDGKSIPGYSDDATLIAQGYVTEASRSARRKSLTSNRVLVSLPPGDSPTSHSYQATYTVDHDTGSKDVDPGPAEFCELGDLVFTYDEDV